MAAYANKFTIEINDMGRRPSFHPDSASLTWGDRPGLHFARFDAGTPGIQRSVARM